jgi:Dolichyl-phosphate-mannose-protein mannosyltransferase
MHDANPGGWTPPRAAFVFLAGLLAFCFLDGLGAYPLLDKNEGLYAEIPREMLAGGSLVVPHLNGVAYLEKPPLLYWSIALGYRLFGVSELVARLPAALAGIATCLIVLAFGMRTMGAAAGWLAAVMLGSSIVFVAHSRTILFDMVFTALVTAALSSAYFALTTGHLRFVRIAYAMLGFAVLAKGLAAVAVAAIAVAGFAIATRDGRERSLAALRDPSGIVLFLAVAVPWHVAAALAQQDFAWFYFVNEHLLRFLGMRTPRDYHTGPIYHYLPRVLLMLAPWSALMLVPPRGSAAQPPLAVTRFLWSWLLAALVFFSLSRAKADYYLLVGMPPVALLLARRVASWPDDRAARWIAWLVALTSVALLATLAAGRSFCGPEAKGLWPECRAATPMALAVFALYTVVALWCCRRFGGTATAVMALACECAVLVPITLDAMRVSADERSQRSVVRWIESRDSQRPIWLYRDFEEISSVVFYAGRRLGIVDSGSFDLLFGQHTPEAAGWFVSLDELGRIAARAPLFVVAQEKRRPVERLGPLGFCRLYSNGRTAVFGNGDSDCPRGQGLVTALEANRG